MEHLYEAEWYGQLLNCKACPARWEARRPVPGFGPVATEFMVIGQNPGEDEDIDGFPFVGKAGQELDKWLTVLGLDRQKIVVTNVCKCKTDRNRVPKPGEVKTCTELWLSRELTTCPNVQVILPLGKPAAEAILGAHARTAFGVMTPWWTEVEFAGRRIHVVPLAHPAYLLRAPGQRPTMYNTVLPAVRDRLLAVVPDAYMRAKR